MKQLVISMVLMMSSVAALAANPQVILSTSKGDITLELYSEKAPKSVANFLEYVRSGHFAGTIFHRVIPHFMIQGGGFTVDMQQKPTRDPIPNEADNGLQNKRGTIAMARTMDPHSATAQFFINVVDNPSLNHQSPASGSTWGYAVFGRVIEGMEVVDEIRYVETHSVGGHQDVPVEPVVIEKAQVVEAEQEATPPA